MTSASYHHLYPFSPWGLHGGTLRLRTAVEASRLHGTTTFSWWDNTQGKWRSDVAVEQIGAPDPAPTSVSRAPAAARLKRTVFPFVLWEAGRRPRSRAAHVLAEQPQATLVLHTTFMAPLADELRRSGRRVVVDVHDAIFRGHMDEAAGGAPIAMRPVRTVYAASVRHRERRALASATRLPVAGWDDTRMLKGLGLTAAQWAPTGLEAQLSPMPEHGQLRVGLLGNFFHSATSGAATELLASPLARDPAVEVILAGIGSERYAASTKVRALGPIASTDEFYDRVHATVVPVTNGTGMKCKLGEASLAGKAVITTQLGAAGYPPALRSAFIVVSSAATLDKRLVIDTIEHVSPDALRAQFEPVVGREAAAHTYAEILGTVGNPSFALQ
ncbi:MAG TPA: glycosyltransferase [Solirubrobacteraceae bacterium]|jgi:hypothetical protein|nr:glycosyltransferase [Solirubrobacteraceae bacterium]